MTESTASRAPDLKAVLAAVADADADAAVYAAYSEADSDLAVVSGAEGAAAKEKE